jgi:hypothetical protein
MRRDISIKSSIHLRSTFLIVIKSPDKNALNEMPLRYCVAVLLFCRAAVTATRQHFRTLALYLYQQPAVFNKHLPIHN